MPWEVEFHPEFEPEFAKLSDDVQDELLGRLQVLAQFGPQLGRPHVDTLENSSFPNMKELRFKKEDGLWRFAFAFDSQRKAIVLVGGDKLGANQKRFYADLIKSADHRFSEHLKSLKRLKER